MTTSIIDAIISLKKGVGVTVEDNSFNKIKWDDQAEKFTKKYIQDEMDRMDKEYSDNEYQRSRASEYPPWNEQLDKIFHDGVAKWKSEMIQPIKDKYPKP